MIKRSNDINKLKKSHSERSEESLRLNRFIARDSSGFALRMTLIGMTLFLPSIAFADEKIPVEARESLGITIYNSNLALVKDKRVVPFKKGVNDITFPEVSAQIRPETALVTAEGTKVLEQNFNFDTLSYHALLQKSVGKKVRLARTDKDGKEVMEEGVLISVQNGTVVKIGDKIDASYPGRVIFNDIPDNLYTNPTLILKMVSDVAEKRAMELAYLTSGLSWKADYVAELNDKETELNIKGMVTLTNTSGADYKNTKLQLVAGSVNQVSGYARPMANKSYAKMDMMVAEEAAGGMMQEALMDYHLYTLPRKVDVLSNQTKQVDLLSGKAKTEKEYHFSYVFGLYPQMEKIKGVKPTVKIVFENNEKSGMGMPLPAGVLRVYKKDKSDSALFVGEDALNHTAKNEKVYINLGQAFDITGSAEQVEYEKISNKEYTATYKMEFKNAKSEPVEIILTQNLPYGFKIESETIKHTNKTANYAAWKIKIDPEKERELVFKIRVKN